MKEVEELIGVLIERSSLGAPGARSLRARTSEQLASEIVDRSKRTRVFFGGAGHRNEQHKNSPAGADNATGPTIEFVRTTESRTAMTVSARFMSLLESIQPSPAELERYESHRSTVATRLATVFPETKVEVIGSHARGSAISGVSDLDLVAFLPRAHLVWGDKLVNSGTVIKNVRDELQKRYGNTDIGKDGVAVVAQFSQGAYSVDIVPAIFSRMAPIGPGGTNRPVQMIPASAGGWLETAPKAHAEYIAQADTRSGGKLKGVAQLLKFWTTTREARIPISSFHIEMVLAQSDVCAGVKSYSTSFTEALQLLERRRLAALQDPLGISGYIEAAPTQSKRDQALKSVSWSAERAGNAILNERLGSVSDAYASWDMVFNGRFPKR